MSSLAHPTSSSLPTLPPIDEINNTKDNKDNFSKYMLPLFEKSPKLIQRLFDSLPFNSYQDLILKAEHITLNEFEETDKLEVINSHPRLGSNVSKLSELSKVEQSHSSLSSVNSDISWPELNKKYEDKFGFRFVIFVNKRPISELATVAEKIISDPQTTKSSEMERALTDFLNIAKDRLKTLTSTL